MIWKTTGDWLGPVQGHSYIGGTRGAAPPGKISVGKWSKSCTQLANWEKLELQKIHYHRKKLNLVLDITNASEKFQEVKQVGLSCIILQPQHVKR